MMKNQDPSSFNLTGPLLSGCIDDESVMGTASWRAEMMELWKMGAAVSMPALVSLWAPSGGFVALFDFLPVAACQPESFPLLAQAWAWRDANGGLTRADQAGRMDPFTAVRAESAGAHFGKAMELWVARLCPDWMDARARVKLCAPRTFETWREGSWALELTLRPEDPEPWMGIKPHEQQALQDELFALRERRIKQARDLLGRLGPDRVWRLHEEDESQGAEARERNLWEAFAAERQRRLVDGASGPAEAGTRKHAPRI